MYHMSRVLTSALKLGSNCSCVVTSLLHQGSQEHQARLEDGLRISGSRKGASANRPWFSIAIVFSVVLV